MFVVHRRVDNPILVPDKNHPWEAQATFNWCPVVDGGRVHVLYRATTLPEQMGNSRLEMSSISHAILEGYCGVSHRRQLVVPDSKWDKYGCEDPRVTYFEGKYYIFYTALSDYPFSAENIKVAVAVAKSLDKIDEKHLVTPFNAKAMALFPERIDGKVAVLVTVNTDRPPSKMAVALLDEVEDLWDEAKWNDWYAHLDDHILGVQRTDSDQVEVGAVPLKTDSGWLVVYSHIQHYYGDNRLFGVEALLLDSGDVTNIISRTAGPFMVTETIYEKLGHVPNVVFPSGALMQGEDLGIFYGAADTVGCVASLHLDHLIQSMQEKKSRQRFVQRGEANPILRPVAEHDWETKAVFNPAAVDIDGSVHILYRAMSADDTSTLGYARSDDGLQIDERLEEPIYVPRAQFETKLQAGNSGCEDPRVVRIEDRLYMTYTGYNAKDVPRVAVSSIAVDDFLARRWNWTEPEAISPNDIMDKNACIFPEKIGSRYLLFHRVIDDICADFADSLNFSQEKLDTCLQILQPRPGMWDGMKVGIAAPPLKVDAGWLLLYHGVSEKTEYRVGAALLDVKDPTVALARTASPIFEPEEKYEKEGLVPNVVFPCGAVRRGDTIFIYYGGADKVVGVATVSLARLLERLEV